MTLEYSKLLKQDNCMVLVTTFFFPHSIFTNARYKVEENAPLKKVSEDFFMCSDS